MNILHKLGNFVLILAVLISCSDDKNNNPVITNPEGTYQYTVPEQTNDGWLTASVTEVGMLEEPLVEMVRMIDTFQNHQIHNILIFKEGKLVFEEYFTALQYDDSPPSNGNSMMDYDREMLHYLASGSKSVTSVLFGIAIKQGFIDPNLDLKITEYFPHYSSILRGSKKDITVKHLLTMTSGLDFDENTYPYGDQRNDVTALFYESDPIRFVLSKSMHAAPGEVFHYNSGVTNVIADIIRLQSDRNLLNFANQYLFEPLGISNYSWQQIRGEYYFASGGLSLRPRDMAKIGQLFLNNGLWEGEQILSPEWIEASMKSYVVPDMNITSGYGYQWWVESANAGSTVINYCMSAGYGEQYMFVVPALELIMVFNGGYFSEPITLSPFQLVDNYIVYALWPE